MADIKYCSSGLFKSDRVWIHPKRIIDSYEIVFMEKGTAYIEENAIQYELNENDILILEPGKEHFGYKPSKNRVSFYWVHFYSENFNTDETGKYLHISEPFALKTLFVQLLHTANTPGYSPRCFDMFCALISEEILFRSKNASEQGSTLAVNIKEWIRININKNPTVKSVSEEFGYHENYISRVFKSSFGIGIKEYIIDTKIKNAKNLLNTTLYSVKQIAGITGYKDENLFIKFFIYHTGMTPTKYRNMYSNTHINKE